MRKCTTLASFLAASAVFLGLESATAGDLPASSEESGCVALKKQGEGKASPEEGRRHDIVVPPSTPRPRTVSA